MPGGESMGFFGRRGVEPRRDWSGVQAECEPTGEDALDSTRGQAVSLTGDLVLGRNCDAQTLDVGERCEDARAVRKANAHVLRLRVETLDLNRPSLPGVVPVELVVVHAEHFSLGANRVLATLDDSNLLAELEVSQ